MSMLRLANRRRTSPWSARSTQRSIGARRAAMAIEWASLGSFLLERLVASVRTREARVAGTSSTSSPRAEGGGTGITTLAVLQSLAQARHRWGREQAQGIWDSAIVKIVLGGGSNADDLADIARLAGDRTEREFSQTAQSGGGKSISSSNRERAILDPSTIRAITPGHGPLMLRSDPQTSHSATART